jgi:predicted RNase H-like nuclease (RuvC/YqgF family)
MSAYEQNNEDPPGLGFWEFHADLDNVTHEKNTIIEKQSKYIESLIADIHNLKTKLDESTEVITNLKQHINVIEAENDKVFKCNEDIHNTNMRLVYELEKRPAYVEPNPVTYESLSKPKIDPTF